MGLTVFREPNLENLKGGFLKVKFWGVNGSIASPCDSSNIRFKLKAALERVRPEDLRSPESLERFITDLPHSLQ